MPSGIKFERGLSMDRSRCLKVSTTLTDHRTYGPIIHARVGLQHYVYINDAKIARDLLEKRYYRNSNICHEPSGTDFQVKVLNLFSSSTFYRRRVSKPWNAPGLNAVWLAMACKCYCGPMPDNKCPMLSFPQRSRKVFAQILNSTRCNGYNWIMQDEALVALKDIMDNPNMFRENIYRYTLSVTRSIAYGRRVMQHSDKLVIDLAQVAENFVTAMAPGRWIIESMPWLSYLPRFLQPWLPIFESFRKVEDKFSLGNYHDTLASLDKHPERATVVKDLKEGASMYEEESEMHSAVICTEILSTGTETTYNSLLVTILALVHYPEVLKKAHEELDRVIGQGRYPTWEDEPDLPYVRAIIKEQQRWRSIAPLGKSQSPVPKSFGYRTVY